LIAFQVFGAVLALFGTALFAAGTLGLLRFPDVYTRLHALTKADTLGLGLVCAGTALYWMDARLALKLLLIWLLVLTASAVLSHLIAHAAREEGVPPWRQG